MTNAYKPTETLTGTTPAQETVTPLHPMDEVPPESNIHGSSVEVRLHYADGTTAGGYYCGWLGWQRWDDGLPTPCEDDATQPIGWSALDGQDGGTK